MYQSQSAKPSPITKSQMRDVVVRKRENMLQSALKPAPITERKTNANHEAQKRAFAVRKQQNLPISARETCIIHQLPNMRFRCTKAGERAPISARYLCANHQAQKPAQTPKRQTCSFVVRKREKLYPSACEKTALITKRKTCTNLRAPKLRSCCTRSAASVPVSTR